MGANHPLPPGRVGNTLVDKLGKVADGLRQLATDFGLRPYRCFLVKVRWTGQRRGEGQQEVVARDELLPTPKIRDTTAQVRDVDTGGTRETGGIRLERVSMRYSEDRILGRGEGGEPPARNEQTFIEVVEDGSVTTAARRRRYAIANVPFLKRGGTSWTVPLERQYQDMGRDGVPLANV